MRIIKIVGIVGASLLLATSLSGCMPKPLPDEERYQYIDNVLKTIDYQTVGNIVEEEVDDGDGILSPSYKIIRYGNSGAFEELEKRLKSSSDTCRGNREIGQINCSYPRVNVDAFYSKKTNIESYIYITDGSSGRGN